ncbi:unnamed protein product [Dibothriocephalus latus]|uniref:Ion transport domain-containing protein n=1 Tax=Dibothriocephalus latus TaxID=60516 RepID=A0A3P7NU04_DIBLA|nr:unnamed protein product [Dibothriocephalus latus]
MVAKPRSGGMMSTLNNHSLPGRLGPLAEPHSTEKPRINLKPSDRRASSPYPIPAKTRALTRKRFCSFRLAANTSISHFRRSSQSGAATQNADSTAETPLASEENPYTTGFGDGDSRRSAGEDCDPLTKANSLVPMPVDVIRAGKDPTSALVCRPIPILLTSFFDNIYIFLQFLSNSRFPINCVLHFFAQLPQLSTKNTIPEYKVQDINASKCIILHYSIFKIVWDWLIVLCTFYFAVVVPFNATFQRDNNERILRNLDMVLEVLFILGKFLSDVLASQCEYAKMKQCNVIGKVIQP